jgi:RHS repeat-associated protein
MRSRFVPALVFLCGFVMGLSGLPAQAPEPTPDENPEGNTGALKSQIETGGSYNAHTGNGTRSVTDLQVPGAVGVYGLDFTRYWNSLPVRQDNPAAANPKSFGASGWSHSWEWQTQYMEEIEQIGGDGGEQIYTTSITIVFPDGHANKYKITRSNWPHPPAPADPRCGQPYTPSERDWDPPGFVRDQLINMTENGSEFWLTREDGGAVHFVNTGTQFPKYQATEVFDPHGLRTNLSYDTNGRLIRVEQEGGRWLTIRWDYISGWAAPVISRVESGGIAQIQFVQYHYTAYRHPPDNSVWPALTEVIYPEEPVPGQPARATYQYEDYPTEANRGIYFSGRRLTRADDPRFAGPMRTIGYSYRGTTCLRHEKPPNDPPSAAFCYFYARANSIATEFNGATGVPVSSFLLHCWEGTRFEHNGFGGLRKFNFGACAGVQGSYSCRGYELESLTDFTFAHPERQNWMDGQPRQVWDARGFQTELVVTPYNPDTGQTGDASGLPSEIRHIEDGSRRLYNRIDPGNSDPRDPNRIHNPYNHWLFSKTDEGNRTTTYTRDARRRVKRVEHPGGTYETFTYNNFNQVMSHRLPSGATVTYVYNGRGLLRQEYNDLEGTGDAKVYTYDGYDRVETMTDGRARAAGAPYTVRMEYNGRNQVTKVHYPSTGANGDPTVTYGYDTYGNCTSIQDELGHVSTFAYDSYGRCISCTEPLGVPGWDQTTNMANRTWRWAYDRDIVGIGGRSASTHTSNEWRLQFEPVFDAAGHQRVTARQHDLNNRMLTETTGLLYIPGGGLTVGPDTETHRYTYDPNGNKSSYTDPRDRLTNYTYNNRDRLWKRIEPLNRITENTYDTTGNKTMVKFPDNRTQQWRDYDGFGQAWTFIDERNNTSNLTYWFGPMKKLRSVTTHREKDNGQTEDQTTYFGYDTIGRSTLTTFADGTLEGITYEHGQMRTWRNRKGKVKTINYDARGREIAHSWNDEGVTPGINRTWDDAGRLLTISNVYSAIDFAYDSAGQVKSEGNWIVGSGGRRQTTFYRYPSGETARILYPNGFLLRRDYTARRQLAATGWAWPGNTPYFRQRLMSYVYYPDGKVYYQESGSGASAVRSAFGYNGRGQISSVHQYRVSPAQRYSLRSYWRDGRDRITAWAKSNQATYNPLENGRGDRYAYDDEAQLYWAWYQALNPGGNASNPQRVEWFLYDALGNRKGDNAIAGRGWVRFLRRDNGLNQYVRWTPSAIFYDDNATWSGEFPNNGVLVQEGGIAINFNSLNQPIALNAPGRLPPNNYLFFGYDPLGRCVKRWIGSSGAPNSNPAIYLYYDGWNLIQEGTGGANATRVYAHGARVDEIVADYNYSDSQFRYHHYDAKGNCIMLTSQTGNLIEQYDYDAFGQPYFYTGYGTVLPNGTAQGNRFLFTGREWLSELRGYDYRNRLYMPQMGRFLQPDPKHFLAGDYNLYRYCHNDPVNKSDPTGLAADVFLDIGFIGYDLYRLATEGGGQGGENWKALALDAGAAAIPFATGAGAAYRAGKAFERSTEAMHAAQEGTETVQRAMSRAELAATESTGLLRGGREGTHYVSDAVNSNASRAQQRLSLPQKPEVRATLEVPAGRLSPPTRVAPNYNMPGSGMQRTATGPIPVRVKKVDPYR